MVSGAGWQLQELHHDVPAGQGDLGFWGLRRTGLDTSRAYRFPFRVFVP